MPEPPGDLTIGACVRRRRRKLPDREARLFALPIAGAPQPRARLAGYLGRQGRRQASNGAISSTGRIMSSMLKPFVRIS